MRKIRVLQTGGTLGQAGPLLSKVGAQDLEIELVRVYDKDSNNTVPSDWVSIAEHVVTACQEGVHGLVVTHGTATLGFTAAALSFIIKDLPIPIALTGSMIPGSDPSSDAIMNIRNAVVVASDADLAEVCVVFSRDATGTDASVMRGSRCRKTSSTKLNAFASINVPELGKVVGSKVYLNNDLVLRKRSSSRVYAESKLEHAVSLIQMHPALSKDLLLNMLHGVKGAVIEAYGGGQLRTDDPKFTDKIVEFGGPIALTSQCWYGGIDLRPDIFEPDRIVESLPNVIPVGDMLPETSLVKMMWVLGNGGDVRSTMQKDVCGDVSFAR